MALILNDRVKETSSTTGVSDFALSGAEAGFQSFSAGVGANNTTYYSVTDGTDWEVGLGTLSGDGLTLARTTVLQSSNADAKVNFSAGIKRIFVTYPADKAVLSDAAQTLTNKTIDYASNTLTGVVPTSAIGTTVQAYDATLLNDADIGVNVQAYDATILKSADIGVTVQSYDATLLNDADIGVNVQAYDANLTSFVGAFTLPTSDGSANQVMQTDGAGNISFATPSAGVTTGKAIAMAIVFGG